MISDKLHVQQLAALLLKKGITDIVISPGSRNAPLINTFTGLTEFNCRNIVDERSAAYFAIGLALQQQKPVALVCSSGTATLNFTPAVAEAFYQNIPLIILTADRPDYWIEQAESQCIRQKDIYKNFTKKGISLPLGESAKELWFSAREINECLNLAVSGNTAPVHINIPLEEPLHKLVQEELPDVKDIELVAIQSNLTEIELTKLVDLFNHPQKIMILAGQLNPHPESKHILARLVDQTGAVVVAEHLSNLSDPRFFPEIDLLMTGIHEDHLEAYQPDLLISFGGQLVSKSLKQFLRKYNPLEHWHLSRGNEHFDTYQSLTKVINMEEHDFLEALTAYGQQIDQDYLHLWKVKQAKVNQLRDDFTAGIEFCDLKAFDVIGKHLPEDSVIHLGNSSPVRYALIHPSVKNVNYYSNRGTAGIDGCLSTAVGFASVSKEINTIILGDLSFFYDSNALWNKYIGPNLRIIVLHNGGGNIFGMINGPADSPAFREHFFAENTHKAEVLAKAFGLDYFKAENKAELSQALNEFYASDQQKAALLEVFTDSEVNSQLFRELFSFVKTK